MENTHAQDIERISVFTEAQTPTRKYKKLRFPFKKFNPIQTAALEVHDQDCNVVVAAATSAGKTVVAELIINETLRDGKKGVFLSPLKAVTKEKFNDWSNPNHGWSGRKLSIVTGDYRLTKKRQRELKEADVIPMTSECLDSITRSTYNEKHVWLLETGVLVVDEAHLITMEGRGDRLESALIRFTSQNPDCRVVLLSATMPNVGQLAGWLKALNGKRTVVIESDWRPCTLETHIKEYPSEAGWGAYYRNEKEKLEAARDIVVEYPKDKFLCFTHSKTNCRNLHEMLRDEGIKCEMHTADLEKKERERVSEEFLEGDLRVIVCTPTLAWGVNLPARRVVVCGTHRGIEHVNPIDIKQMVGRAGRVGLDPRGDAYVLIAQHEAHKERPRIANIPEIRSCLEEFRALAFHVIAQVGEGGAKNVDDLYAWYSRSYAAYLGQTFSREDWQLLVDNMVKKYILKIGDDGNLEATMLGNIASWMYQDPYDVSDWYMNFNRLKRESLFGNDVALAWALGTTYTNIEAVCRKNQKEPVQDFLDSCVNLGLPPAGTGIIPFAYYSAIKSQRPPFEFVSEIRGVRFDAERTCQTLKMIDSRYAHWKMSKLWKALEIRIKDAVPTKLVELVMHLDNVGATRARKLHMAGLGTLEKIARKPKSTKRILGPTLGKQVYRQAKAIVQGEE